MSELKYKVGDRVRIKSLDWYNENKDEYGNVEFSTRVFVPRMSKYCGMIVTIEDIFEDTDGNVAYYMDGIDWDWTDEMIEGKVEEESTNYSKVIDNEVSNPIIAKTSSATIDTDKGFYSYSSDGNLEMEWNLPQGYQFIDENGNVINATKIVLEKKKKEYPKTYEECLKILGFTTIYTPKVEPMFDYDDDIIALQKLKNCRDAYWKIAGEEMGLGKPWKPDWNDGEWKWCISYSCNCVEFDQYKSKHHTLAFPTKEMRDAFYENFKELIESCKEFL